MAESKGGGVGSAMRGALTTLVILGLLGVVGFLLAERNRHRYFLSAEGQTVVVERGLELPYGHGAFRPQDPSLAGAYAPLRLPAGVAAPGDEEFDDRGDLDRRLGDLLLASAKARLGATDPARLAEGIAILDRAELLQQLTSDQRRRLTALRSEVAYFEASDRIARALGELRDARDLLHLAAEGRDSHARESAELLDTLTPALDRLVRATRGAEVPAPAVAAAPEAPDGGMGDGGHPTP